MSPKEHEDFTHSFFVTRQTFHPYLTDSRLYLQGISGKGSPPSVVFQFSLCAPPNVSLRRFARSRSTFASTSSCRVAKKMEWYKVDEWLGELGLSLDVVADGREWTVQDMMRRYVKDMVENRVQNEYKVGTTKN